MQPRQPRGGFYASEYRRDGNFERSNPGSKPYSQPPFRRGGFNDGDVFVEAGRLAAEYLVSQGLLPPNVLNLRLNDNCNVGGGVGVGGFRKQGESVVEGGGGRASALNRLGNNVDGGMSWRRKPGFEEFGQKGSGRRRGGFRSNGFDWGRDFRRNESWNDRYRGNMNFNDDDDDGVTGQQDEEHQQQQQEDGVGGGDVDVLQKPDSNEIVPKSEDGDGLDAETDKDGRVSGELLDSKQNSSGAEKDAYNMEMEFGESSNDLENVSGEVKEVKEKDVACADDDDENDMEKSSISKNLSVQSNDQENMSSSTVFTDLLSFCKSVKVPTRIRSSRTNKNLKADHHHDDEDEIFKDMGSLQGPDVITENESVKGPSSGDLLSEKTYDLEHTDSDIVKVEPVQDVENTKEFDTICNAEEVQPIGFQSGQDGGFMHDNGQESSATVPEYGSCSTMAEERGEKRAAEAGDMRVETKRLREWLPVLVPRTGEYFVNSNRMEIKESLVEDEISLIDKVTMSSDQESLMSSQFTQGRVKPSLKCSEEKQSLPSSFRTCDLNLIEASEVHENHVDHPILIYPPGTKAKKELPVDIGLPMSHASISGKFSTHSTSGKEIEIIDLENDSTEEEKPVENMERKTDNMFQGLEGFTNHAQSTGDINDVQDGYGLMISELLATDFPNCSSVPSDINSVHNEMDLHNGPEPLIGEDDSIYMSLGEIPLSFLRSWEQPPSQDYQKPF
ncbi:PREDICTED: uncharacterized protein At4g26450-like isoform X1 [Lupinus angustifolius]|uniref:uncharacterized protein At4g26450-like isoform X1 n=1 Tax=Lupinus angustifolius TaxID=3871 RepID=UPI00092E8B1B|nr:PREDICTED: uncharacterized protein At4g26450-like isoform X1 [Lupinus angustifolius]XP_019431983.1 PREDICTED: uncharacterized protein At4g26450-like isoform X1 [Lupinus angustifolius]XP_019431984.1 PREDICTED: uncharacterized protein At4g26450-like isoform X1 [Lupinus angustifolius]